MGGSLSEYVLIFCTNPAKHIRLEHGIPLSTSAIASHQDRLSRKLFGMHKHIIRSLFNSLPAQRCRFKRLQHQLLQKPVNGQVQRLCGYYPPCH